MWLFMFMPDTMTELCARINRLSRLLSEKAGRGLCERNYWYALIGHIRHVRDLIIRKLPLHPGAFVHTLD